MLGQAQTPRRRSTLLAALALVVLSSPAAGGANPSGGVLSLRAHDAELAARARSAALGLFALDHSLATTRTRLAGLRRQAGSLRARRALLELQLRVARRSTALAERRLGDRVRELYEAGTIEPIEIVLGSTTLDAAVANIENLSRVSSQSRDVLAQLRAARTHLEAASRTLAAHEAALAQATHEAEATAAALSAARVERSAYVSSLHAKRRLTERQIVAAEARAHAAQARSAAIAASTAAASSRAAAQAPAAAGGRTVTVVATGYSLGGRTSTGLPVGWGVAAVDPSVIPLGSHMTVPGYGEAVAADTGGAVVGATIDLWFPTVAQANAWGRRTVSIVLG